MSPSYSKNAEFSKISIPKEARPSSLRHIIASLLVCAKVPRLSFNGQVANFIKLINRWSLQLYYGLECVRAEASYRLIMCRETKRAYMGIQ